MSNDRGGDAMRSIEKQLDKDRKTRDKKLAFKGDEQFQQDRKEPISSFQCTECGAQVFGIAGRVVCPCTVAKEPKHVQGVEK